MAARTAAEAVSAGVETAPLTSDVASNVSARAISVTIPEGLRWADSRCDQAFSLPGRSPGWRSGYGMCHSRLRRAGLTDVAAEVCFSLVGPPKHGSSGLWSSGRGTT